MGDASGMFPIDCKTKDYDEDKIAKFDRLVEPYHFDWKLKDILPKSLVAGQEAGTLTAEGAKMLDPTGTLEAGAPMCPPEGDAGTGMVATNSVASPYRKCIGRYFCLCDDRYGRRVKETSYRDRSCDNAGW